MGLAFHLPDAKAQPTILGLSKKSFKPLAPEQKATVDKIFAVARVQDFCAIKLDLKMENATLDDVVAAIKNTLPNKNISVEIRDAKPVRVSFDLKEASVGKTLTTIATLAGCKLYVFDKGLVIAPASKLTEAELLELRQDQGGEWATDRRANPIKGWYLKPALDPPTIKQNVVEAYNTTVDLKMESATLEDVLAAIKEKLGKLSGPVEVRGATSIQASFDLKGLNAGNTLTPFAALAGCDLYVLNSGLLLSPPSKLTEAEKVELKEIDAGIWEDNTDRGSLHTGGYVVDGIRHAGWQLQTQAQRLFSSLIAQEVAGNSTKSKPAVNATRNFGDFSPEAQLMLQQMVNWSLEDARQAVPDMPHLNLSANSRVSINASPEAVSFDFAGDLSDKKAPKIAMTTFLP